MIKNLAGCLALLLMVAHVNAQTARGTLKGRLADTANHEVLRGATIMVLNAKDSALVTQAVAGTDGRFMITKIPKGVYTLEAIFTGYETRYKQFAITDSIFTLDAGNIYLRPFAHKLKDVIVESPPIVIKVDTVEYNAEMYNVKPNSTAADLLQKLPGVDVDQQGNVKAQGETVQRVLLNGKRFFGDDPKMATQNLPSDLIDKIQVFDDLSDQSKFTGFDDGNRVKTINIVTKKNMRTGYFGKVVAGGGTDGLYDENANLSKFKGEEQVTVLGQGNNTNRQNFTVQGGGGGGGGAGNIGGSAGAGFGGAGGNRAGNSPVVVATPGSNAGLTTTWAGGLNYRNDWGKTEAYGSYFYNNLKTVQDQKSYTQNFLSGDSTLNSNQVQNSTSRAINQRINLNIEPTFDSANSMIIRPNGSIQQSDGAGAATTTTTRGPVTPVSSAMANTNTNSNGYNSSSSALFRHRFKKRGRTFSLDLSWSGNVSNGTGNNYSNSIYTLPTGDSTHLINQYYNSKVNSQTLNPTFSYTEPIGKKSIVELNYSYTYTKNTADRYTYDFDSATKAFSLGDSLLTNTYQSHYNSNRATLSYRYQNTNLNFSIGSGVQLGNLTSINTSKNDTVGQHYTNLYPTANLTYRITKSTTLKFNYSGRTAQPSAQQLEPVINNSDPNNIQIGNPALKQTFTNTFRLLFISFNQVKLTNMFASINANFVNNNIVNQTITNRSTGVDSIKPVNLGGTVNLSGFFNYGFPLKKPKSNLNFTTNLSDTRGVSVIGTDEGSKVLVGPTVNYTNNVTLGETVKWTTNLKQDFDMNFSGAPTDNIVHYSQYDSSIKYFSLLLAAEATWYTKSGWILTSSFNFTYYGGREAGYNTAVPLLNAGIAKQFLKNKRGEIRLTVHDLLNQAVSITRKVTPTYVQDVQTRILTRYALLTFTYNIRSFNQGQQQGRRGGGRGGFGGGVPGGRVGRQ